MSVENLVRIGAGLAALVLAGPALATLVAGWLKAHNAPATPAAGHGIGMSEAQTVLALADAFRQAGQPEAVALCQQLLDHILHPKAPPS
jgi:hypothetical protein